MEILEGVWKPHLRPRAVVGYGVKIFLPSPPNYVTRSPGEWFFVSGAVRYKSFSYSYIVTFNGVYYHYSIACICQLADCTFRVICTLINYFTLNVSVSGVRI